MIDCIVVHDLKEANGKSIKENNMAKKHTYEVGQLVELPDGCRLYIAQLTRDVDGTRLYSVSPFKENTDYCHIDSLKWLHGYSEESLRPVK